MAEKILSLMLEDGTELDIAALAFIGVTSKGNLEISTPEGGKLNIETSDNLALKPNGKLQLDTNHFALDEDKDEFEVSVICDKGSKVQGLKMEVAGLKFVSKDADKTRGWDPDVFKVFFKKDTGAVDTYTKVNMHFASLDLRARSTGAGTGGGIAVQIAGVDSNIKENKFKVETDRTVDVTEATTAANHCGEGGKGIEIVTINSQFTSIYTKDYRFRADAPVYAVTRGALYEDSNTGKVDYPTQADDSKDIINDSNPVTWADIIAAAKYFKSLPR